MRQHIIYCVALFCCTMNLNAQDWVWQNPLPNGWRITDAVMLSDHRIVAVGWRGECLISFDMGKTWQERSNTPQGLTNLVAVNDTIWAWSYSGYIYRSTDLAESWDVQLTPHDDRNSLYRLHMHDGSHGMAIVGLDLYIRTSDGGTTWEEFTINDVSPLGGQRVLTSRTAKDWYIGSMYNLLVTTDFGHTWSEKPFPHPVKLQSVKFIDDHTGYMCVFDTLYRTTDTGQTWVNAGVSGLGDYVEIVGGRLFGDVIYIFSIDRSGLVEVLKSTDRGVTWQTSLPGWGSDVHSFTGGRIFFADSLGGLVVDRQGNLNVTTDGGENWISPYSSLRYQVLWVDFANTDHGLACFENGYYLYTSDGGEYWETFVIGVFDEIPSAPSFYSSGNGYSLINRYAEGSFLLETSDYGRTYQDVSRLLVWKKDGSDMNPQKVIAVTEDTIYIAYKFGYIGRSFDGGATFDTLRVSSHIVADVDFSFAAFPPQTLLYIAYNGTCISTDAGRTWEFRNKFGNMLLDESYVLSPELIYGKAQNHFAKTVDGGMNWTYTPIYANNGFHFFDELRGIMYAPRRTSPPYEVTHLFRTSDGGETWVAEWFQEAMDVNDFFWLDENTGWAYGFQGTIRKTSNGGTTGIVTPPQAAGSIRIEQTYPNPVSMSQAGAAMISFELPRQMEVTLSVYDMLGRKVAVLVDDIAREGMNSVRFIPPNDSPPGTYFVALRTPDGIYTQKFVVIR
ncbi:MAG: hypothetical protein CL946_05075 [Ectothiorhodospiraceae bacterium]|nr:hypothetical protein [Ectothiorhodospiraceae bacterium]